MGLSYLMLTGSLSGLLSILLHSVLASGAELVRGEPRARTIGAVTVTEAFLHMLCGVVLGAFFWLSWGLAAVVGVPWWVRGAAFAALCWAALAAPLLLDLALERRLPTRTAALAAVRWATTCFAAGLACAWSWQRAM